MELYWILTLILIFATYLVFITTWYGTLDSISMSYYKLKEDRLEMLFYVFCIALGIPLFNIYILTQDVIWVVSAFGFALVGSAMRYYENKTVIAHYVGAGLGISSALLGVWVTFGYYLPAIAMIPVILIAIKIKNTIWWIELGAFAIIVTAMLYGVM